MLYHAGKAELWINDSLANGAYQSSTGNCVESGTMCSACQGRIHGPLDLSHGAVKRIALSVLLAVGIDECRTSHY